MLHSRQQLLVAIGLLSVFLGAALAAQPVRGHPVIIGGGKRGLEITTTIVRLAGDARSKIVVFPMGRSLADSMASEQIAFLKNHGAVGGDPRRNKI